MTVSLFVNRLPACTRLALTVDGRLEDFAVHHDGAAPGIGSIFMARVVHVHQGIQAAFCDVGGKDNVFLDRGDLPRHWIPDRKTPIESILKEGRTLPVQLKRAAFDGKLAQVTADIKLTGYRLILLPFGDTVHFSKEFQASRAIFQETLEGFGEFGWIVRAAAGKQPQQALAEAESLVARFKAELAGDSGKARLLKRADPVRTYLQDRGLKDLSNVYLDDAELAETLQTELTPFAPQVAAKIKVHLSDTQLFDTYKIESAVDKLRAGMIHLKSGGRMTIQKSEGMTAIDLDSGKQGKDRGGVSTALRTNLEAVPEIARQIRMRNLAGLIVIDFINAREKDWRSRVDKALRDAMKADPARVDLLPLNRFGLACISRERRGEMLPSLLTIPCDQCKGTGRVDKWGTLALDIQVQLLRQVPGMEGERFAVRCGQGLADYLTQRKDMLFAAIENTHQVTIAIQKDMAVKPYGFDIKVQ